MTADELVVHDDTRQHHSEVPQYDQVRTVESTTGGPPKRYGLIAGQWVQLTAAGLPRKKPGRKPGTIIKPKGEGSDQGDAKVRKPRKPRDPNAPPIQRKRKIAPADAGAENIGPSTKVLALGAPNESSPLQRNPSSMSPSQSHQHHQQSLEHRYSPSAHKRDLYPPSSMQNILNADPPSRPQSTSNGSSIPVRSSGQTYDPIRDGKYDPVRETMIFSNAGSPRAPGQTANRSPSIASMIEPQASAIRSPGQSHNGYQPSSTHTRLPGDSLPASPSQLPRPTSNPTPTSRPAGQELRKDQPPAPPPITKPVIRESQFTTIANGPVKKSSPKQKPVTGVSTPKTDTLDDMGQEGEGRSILDFGRAKPGEEAQAPTIVLNIPIRAGETNKYVNFMRLAEDRFGWDALHPRLAANRDRKARIAAAAASLEKVESGRESGDDMSVDLSDVEASNPENGATSGVDAQAKPKKKRKFKEDDYDVDDDFVDDSELMWEAQAAASQDGFFVYSGPLVPEVEKPTGYVYMTLIDISPEPVANFILAMKVLLSAVEAAEVVVVVLVVLPRVVEPALAVAVALVREVVPLRGSLASPSLRRHSVSARRLSARRWRNSARLPPRATYSSPRLPRFRPRSSVPRDSDLRGRSPPFRDIHLLDLTYYDLAVCTIWAFEIWPPLHFWSACVAWTGVA